MKKDKYRLFCGVAIFAVIYFLIFFANKAQFFKLLNELMRENIMQTTMPSYMYMSNAESYKDTGIMGAILNDIYPMNEYLLVNENYIEVYDESDNSVIRVDSANAIKGQYAENIKTSDNKNSENESLDDNGVINIVEGEYSQGKKENSQNFSVGFQNPAVAVATSRNAITGKVYDRTQLNNYDFTKKFYTVTSITSLTNDIFKPAELLEMDMSITHDSSTPQILIFHTHSQENFKDSKEGDISTGIVGVGEYLTQLLTQKYGYNVIHDTSVYDCIDGKLDRSKAYTYANEGIEKILEKYPSIEVVIDLHRDGVNENTHLVTEIDGKQTARVMLFNGISYTNVNGEIDYLANPHRSANLATSLQMYLLGEAYYQGFLRNNYINAYRYCLHHRGKSMLVEAGAQTNTFEEVKNAMEPLADMLDKMLKGERAY